MASPSPAPPPAPSIELTSGEISYLEAQKNLYFSSNKLDKRDLRLAIVARFLEQRDVGPDNPYAHPVIDSVRPISCSYCPLSETLSFPLQKVKNWFGNHGPVRPSRLPFKIHRNYTGKRVFEIVKKDEIMSRKRAAEGKANVQSYNDARDALWKEQTSEEIAEWEEMAADWNVKGPDDAYKPS